MVEGIGSSGFGYKQRAECSTLKWSMIRARDPLSKGSRKRLDVVFSSPRARICSKRKITNPTRPSKKLLPVRKHGTHEGPV